MADQHLHCQQHACPCQVRLSGRVSVDDIPSGHRHLTGIMEAMTENSEIEIKYRKYTSSETETFTLRPYAVKEASRRWYVVAYCIEREAIRVYGLDRVAEMTATGKKFRMPEDFGVEELFATSFGIYIPDGKGRTITFRATEREAKYLRDLPIHSSQKEVRTRGDGVVFEIFVCPNTDLIMEFCRRGDRIEVLSPSDIREAVAGELRKAAEQYGR